MNPLSIQQPGSKEIQVNLKNVTLAYLLNCYLGTYLVSNRVYILFVIVANTYLGKGGNPIHFKTVSCLQITAGSID